jgi:DNA-binding response OmpR family regulator
MTSESASSRKLNFVLYSDDSTTRAALVSALGKQVSPELGEHEIRQFATADALRLYVDSIKPGSDRPIDLFILDGEAAPEGGMGVARQLKDEVFNCPPVLLIVARKEDAWLAAWSRAEASVTHPIDPFTLADTVASLIRNSSVSLR